MSGLDQEVIYEHGQPNPRELLDEGLDGGQRQHLHEVGGEPAARRNPSGREARVLRHSAERHYSPAGVLVQGGGEQRRIVALHLPQLPETIPGNMFVKIAEVPRETRRGLRSFWVSARLGDHGLDEDEPQQRASALMA